VKLRDQALIFFFHLSLLEGTEVVGVSALHYIQVRGSGSSG